MKKLNIKLCKWVVAIGLSLLRKCFWIIVVPNWQGKSFTKSEFINFNKSSSKWQQFLPVVHCCLQVIPSQLHVAHLITRWNLLIYLPNVHFPSPQWMVIFYKSNVSCVGFFKKYLGLDKNLFFLIKSISSWPVVMTVLLTYLDNICHSAHLARQECFRIKIIHCRLGMKLWIIPITYFVY